jgi:hypothetical protein
VKFDWVEWFCWFVNSVPQCKLDGHWLRRFRINQSVIYIALFKVGIAQYRLRKVLSAWRVNAISIWRYSLYGRGIKYSISDVTWIPHNVECNRHSSMYPPVCHVTLIWIIIGRQEAKGNIVLSTTVTHARDQFVSFNTTISLILIDQLFGLCCVDLSRVKTKKTHW